MFNMIRTGLLLLGIVALGPPQDAAGQTLCEGDGDCVRECFVGHCNIDDVCEFTPDDFAPCADNDGNPCTAAECRGGSCRQDVPAAPGTFCSANDECMRDECDSNGTCGIPRSGDECQD